MKKVLVTISAAALALLLTACAGGEAKSDKAADDGVYGVVSSISGNELSVELGKLKQIAAGSVEMGDMQQAMSIGGAPPKENEARLENKGSVSIEGSDMQSFVSEGAVDINGGAQTGEQGDANRQDKVDMSSAAGGISLGGVSLERSGETGVFTLPVNVKVTLEIGSEKVDASFSQIEKGDVLRLTFDNDKVNAIAIMGKEVSSE